METTKTAPDWELRLGLIVMTPLIFVMGGMKAVIDNFREFWNG